MERRFLSQKGIKVRRGVKEKNLNRNKTNKALGIGMSTESDYTMNEDTLVGVAASAGSLTPLSTPGTTTAGNAPGKSSYATVTKVAYPVVANYVRNTWGKYGLVRSMFSLSTGLFSYQFSFMDGLDVMLENGPWSSYDRAMIELRADIELKDSIVVAMPKLTKEGHYICNVRVWVKFGGNLARNYLLVGKLLLWIKLVGFGTQSLLKQWRDSYSNGDYDEDPYDDDMYDSSSTRLFSYQFSFIDGLDVMLENGPWFIRNNPLFLKKWHSDENRDTCSVPVWVKLYGVPVTAFSKDGLSAIATKLAMIELRADVELKDSIVVAMPKLTRESHYICNVPVEYEWKPPRCESCKVFGHIHEECPKNTGVEYRHVPKNPTRSSSDNKKKGVVPTIKVSNSNPFEVLNLVNNDVELGTNGWTTSLVNNEATSSGSSFMNVDNSSPRTTPIIDKIGKFKELLTSGKATLVDEVGNPLKKVEYPDDYDSKYEVASVDNNMARSMDSKWVGFGT
ncbi:RNA-directed DNA polymerase, eukaryota, reverse transcriptase zinc-binding domain protein [Tanacetum coccineum]